jgi:hypothetical protein
MEIGIIPVLKQSVTTIISCLLDGFGYFEIAKLIVTESFLKIREYNSIYDHMISQKWKKEFKRLIREKTYRTKFELLIDTSTKQLERSKYTTNLGCKHFCYDTFTKGELRVVASTTYILDSDDDTAYITPDHLLQFSDNERGLIIRGEELNDTRIKIDIHNNTYHDKHFCKNLISIP